MPIQEVEKIWSNGELVDWADARFHVLSHALHYGSGVFEGIRAYSTARGPAVWHLDAHLDRMFASAAVYHMEIPYSKDELIQATKETIRVNGLDACYIRPIAFRGYGEMGVNPLLAPIDVVIAVWPWGAYLGEDALEQGVRVKVSSWKRHDQNALPSAAKATGGYLGSILAKVESLKAGYDEAIMLNHEGYVAEGSGENVFVVTQGGLLTPPTGVGCLAGVTRGSVIDPRPRPRLSGARAEPGAHRPVPRRRGVLHRHGGGADADPRGGRSASSARATGGRSRRSSKTRSSRRRRARVRPMPAGSPT